MDKFLPIILAFTLISNPSFAGKTPEKTRSSNPDRGGDRGSDRGSRNSGEPDDRGDASPDWGGSRGSYDDVDRSDGGYRGGMFIETRDLRYVDQFLALREVFQSVSPQVRDEIRNSYEPKLAFWTTVTLAAAAGWTYLKTNPTKVAVRTALRTTVGMVLGMVAYSANAGEDYNGMIEEDLFNIFDNRFWDVEGIRYALSPDYRSKIERIIDVSSTQLCSSGSQGKAPQIASFCSNF